MARTDFTSKAPRDLKATKATARNFYDRMEAGPLLDHVKKVQKRAEADRIVESEPINAYDPEDGEKAQRAWANSDLTEIIHYHLIDHDKLVGFMELGGEEAIGSLPAPLQDDAILSELEVFSALAKLNCRGAPLKDYLEFLNDREGPPPYALLAMIEDLAVTHMEGDDLNGMVGPDHGLFRTYSTAEEAERCLRNDAKAAEVIYAKLAELFGYSALAGDIYNFAFEVNHPLIYEHVKELREDGGMNERLKATQELVGGLKKDLEHILRRLGFADAKILMRDEKHDGKKMKNIYQDLVKRYKEDVEGNGMTFDSYVAKHIDEYDLFFFPDPVAMKVVVNKFQTADGSIVEIDELPEEGVDEETGLYKAEIIDLAVRQVKIFLDAFKMAYDYDYEYKYRDKDNGYKDHKFAAKPKKRNGKLPFEVQVKTKMWHYLAEYGGAAHYLYLGRNEEESEDLVELIALLIKKYKGIVHCGVNGGNGDSMLFAPDPRPGAPA